jgi:hypothetical protein
VKIESKRQEKLRKLEKKRIEMLPPRNSSDESDEDSDENDMIETSDVEVDRFVHSFNADFVSIYLFEELIVLISSCFIQMTRE